MTTVEKIGSNLNMVDEVRSLSTVFKQMLNELESYQLHVGLVPAPDPKHHGHMIRVAYESNPPWYQELCKSFPSGRKDSGGGKRTKVKRQCVLRVLRRLVQGLTTTSQYYPVLVKEARMRLEKEPF